METEQFELYLIRHGVAAERGEQLSRRHQAAADERRHAEAATRSEGARRARRDVRRDSHQPAGAHAADGRDDRVGRFATLRRSSTCRRSRRAARTTRIIDELTKQHRRHHIAIVGHEPGIGELAARLMGLRRALEFKKGAVCRIDVAALPPAGPGRLRWFLTPRILRKLGK